MEKTKLAAHLFYALMVEHESLSSFLLLPCGAYILGQATLIIALMCATSV